MKLEQIEFENLEKFKAAIDKVIAGDDVFRSYEDKDKNTQRKKIISNKRLYVGNNFSININQSEPGKVYLSIDYFSVEDRIRIAHDKKNVSKDSEL